MYTYTCIYIYKYTFRCIYTSTFTYVSIYKNTYLQSVVFAFGLPVGSYHTFFLGTQLYGSWILRSRLGSPKKEHGMSLLGWSVDFVSPVSIPYKSSIISHSKPYKAHYQADLQSPQRGLHLYLRLNLCLYLYPLKEPFKGNLGLPEVSRSSKVRGLLADPGSGYRGGPG